MLGDVPGGPLDGVFLVLLVDLHPLSVHNIGHKDLFGIHGLVVRLHQEGGLLLRVGDRETPPSRSAKARKR